MVLADHSIAPVDPGTGLAHRLFVANAEHHAFGVSAPNLDIGAVRNAKILNSVLGREAYRLPQRTAFISFGPDDDAVDGPVAPSADHLPGTGRTTTP